MTFLKNATAFLLCLILCLSVMGCGKTEEGHNAPADTQKSDETTRKIPSDTEKKEPVEEILSRAPEHYDYAVLVSINPEFVLYMSGREVFAYEALNEDAAKVAERCAIIGRGIDGVMDDIVKFSYEEGFLKDGGDVNVTLVGTQKTAEESDNILQEAKETASATASRCGIAINSIVLIDDSVEFASPQDDQPEPGDEHPQNPWDDPGRPGDDHPEDPQNPGDDHPQDPMGPGEDTNEHHEPRKEEGCPVCRGTGICDRCDGSGIMDCGQCRATGYEICTKCMGAGHAGTDENGPVTCDKCAGTGLALCNLCAGTKVENCNGCAGSGKCSACGGTGKKSD